MKYSQLQKVKEELIRCASHISSEMEQNPALLAAEETENEHVMETVVTALVEADLVLKNALSKLDFLIEKSANVLDENDIDAIGALASNCETSEDPNLRKQASVLDQLLINFAQGQELERAKMAQEDEITKLREKYKNISHEVAYEKDRGQREEQIKSDAAKAIKDQLVRKRPLEASLNTRYCPDHHGSGVIRVGEGIFQCPLDKKLYNYYEGFTTNKGEQVPGGDVARQTQNLGDRKLEQTNFSTRENKLNQI